MISTFFLADTVLRSSAEWPCTSALGLFTRRYSAGKSKRSPPSKVTVSVLRSLCRRSSLGQASVIIFFLNDKKHAAGVAQVVAAHFLRARGQLLRAQELEQHL